MGGDNERTLRVHGRVELEYSGWWHIVIVMECNINMRLNTIYILQDEVFRDTVIASHVCLW